MAKQEDQGRVYVTANTRASDGKGGATPVSENSSFTGPESVCKALIDAGKAERWNQDRHPEIIKAAKASKPAAREAAAAAQSKMGV